MLRARNSLRDCPSVGLGAAAVRRCDQKDGRAIIRNDAVINALPFFPGQFREAPEFVWQIDSSVGPSAPVAASSSALDWVLQKIERRGNAKQAAILNDQHRLTVTLFERLWHCDLRPDHDRTLKDQGSLFARPAMRSLTACLGFVDAARNRAIA